MTCCENISHVFHFQLSGYVNKQNYHYWAPKNPQQLLQHPLHSDKMTGTGSLLLGPLALTSLKTANTQWLLSYPTVIWKCYATSLNDSYVAVELISLQYGSNKKGQEPIHQGHQCVFSEKCFHNTLFLWQ
jgi:hypothetical protein